MAAPPYRNLLALVSVSLLFSIVLNVYNLKKLHNPIAGELGLKYLLIFESFPTTTSGAFTRPTRSIGAADDREPCGFELHVGSAL